MSIVGGIASLTMGTVAARALSMGAQVLLAIWLSPAEFGYWAAATASLAFFSGLTNFGEVNAFLSGHGSSFRQTRRTTRRLNLVLVFLGLVLAVTYWISGNPRVAVLVAIGAVTIPVVGESDLLYAAGVQQLAYKRVVLAQVAGSACKLGVGVVLAATTQSATAIAISAAVFYLIMSASLSKWAGNRRWDEGRSEVSATGTTRFAWGANSLAMTLPLQASFFVAQFIAAPEVLGLYFLAFQVTVGLAGLVTGPLARVALSTLGRLGDQQRLSAAIALAHMFGAGTLACAALIATLVPAVDGFVPTQWQGAIPAFVVLLAGMPARLMGPVVDAYQQASNKWWQGTSFNLIDAFGMAAASLTAIFGNLMILVTAVTLWKLLLSVVRIVFVFFDAGLKRICALILPTLIGSCGLILIAFTNEYALAISILCVCVAVGWLLLGKKTFFHIRQFE